MFIGFNEAAAMTLRKTRTIGGDAFEVPARFNEAAAMTLRKTGVAVEYNTNPTSSGFNEAAAMTLRKTGEVALLRRPACRSFNEAAAMTLRKTTAKKRDRRSYERASMRPQR